MHNSSATNNNPQVPFHWENAVRGFYDLCYGNETCRNARVHIVDLDVVHANLSDSERHRRFGNAKYAWAACREDLRCHNRLLGAQTLEEAKQEFEVWYANYLTTHVEKLEKALAAAKAEQKDFTIWRCNHE